MLRQALRPAQLRCLRAWPTSMPIARVGLIRPYSDTIMSNSLPKKNSDGQTKRDNRSPQDPTQTLTQADSISSVIKQDHREIERYYDNLVNSKDPDTQRRYQNAFVWELTRHAIAEELVVYPSMETGVSNGKEMADKDRAEHQVTKEALYKFQKMSPGDKDFIPTLESLMKDLRMHIKEEEEEDLVKLEEALLPTRSRDLAQQFETTKSFTPTRSHPSAPNRPPFESVVGLMAAPLDKLRDIFRAWPDEPSRKPPSGGPAR
ncbi:hypothetical protein F5Y05DRAFT_374749 [Hypoxylon sp. FL0543]|nr:hypothetical protein F5Y05DRAFT_374749 [Hypoxylon sp. FL0543]